MNVVVIQTVASEGPGQRCSWRYHTFQWLTGNGRGTAHRFHRKHCPTPQRWSADSQQANESEHVDWMRFDPYAGARWCQPDTTSDGQPLTSTFPTPILSRISPRALSKMKAEDALNVRVLLRHMSERGTAAASGAPFRKYASRMRIVEACFSRVGGRCFSSVGSRQRRAWPT